MYSTCIFCHADLGRNEAVEHFPIGRRLAFDAARGRLWVVCRKCERWNLSPLEERWEAIEECERLFRDTRLRVSTDNIGLARIREGLELVRIGEPRRPEMAAWRYGDQFGRRRSKHLLQTGAGIAVAAGLVILGPATGIIAGSSWGLWNIFTTANNAYQQRRVRARVALPGQEDLATIRLKQLNRVAIAPYEDGWALEVPYEETRSRSDVERSSRSFRLLETKIERSAVLTGDDALRAAGRLLPAINASGARKSEVQSAVSILEHASDSNAVFTRFAQRGISAADLVLRSLPKEVRLAFEMASHEDAERRALEGELSVLEAAWREAEEIAAIADELFVPEETRRRLSALKPRD